MEEEIKACMNYIIYRVCQREYDRKYYQKVKEKNKEIFRKRSEAWRENNPDKYNEGGIKPQPDRGYFMPGKGKIYLGKTESLAWTKGFDVGEALGEIEG